MVLYRIQFEPGQAQTDARHSRTEDRAKSPRGACGNATERRSRPTECLRQEEQLYGKWRRRSFGGHSILNWNTLSKAKLLYSRRELETG